ncbi:hypothetical protein CEP54_015923 [Fusarium duplospermum]|uniref:Aldehyde dehydrogenase domain-containing protein n=1 Tax=Fusarium duplospermum TaxID=1325734 RepID=A0A428NK72_9HYPO|nr:hypothetical protein CEP54_015923 [Fusarium duplospermum]
MAITITDAVATASLSWQSNYTLGDPRWSLKQLHRLHQLIIDHRDEIIRSVSTSASAQYHEKELARLVFDISQHVASTGKPPASQETEIPLLGKFAITSRPAGVSVIVCGEGDPLRWMLGPLAASIAAGNTTVLATTLTRSDPLIAVLSREWANYLDRDCNLFVHSCDCSQLDMELVDKVTLCDNSSEPYQSILSSPKAQFFYTTSPDLNIGLITEGKKSWPCIVEEIKATSNLFVPQSDRLHVIFVREEDFKPFQNAIGHGESTIVLDTLKQKEPNFQLDLHLETAKEKGTLLVVLNRSLEGAIDAMVGILTPIAQLAILGPEASKVHEFAKCWVPARVISVGSICPVALPELRGAQYPRANSPFFSPLLFSNPTYHSFEKPSGLPNDVIAIRASYKGIIKPLKPEPRGERIGFFTQVEYLVKGVGATVGLLAMTGLYFGLRKFR